MVERNGLPGQWRPVGAVPNRPDASAGRSQLRRYQSSGCAAASAAAPSGAALRLPRFCSIGAPQAWMPAGERLDGPAEPSRYAVTKAATQAKLGALMEKDDIVAMEPWLKLANG